MNPVLPFLVVLIILFILWLFWGGGNYEYLGLKPLDPKTRAEYMVNDHVCHLPPKSQVPDVSIYEPVPDVSMYEEPASPEREELAVCEVPRKGPKIIIEEEETTVDRTPRLPARFVGGGQEIGRKGKESKGQKQTCETLERIYRVPFARNVRPSFLRNPETGSNLEYDCYNPDLRIAAEYNGPQHYQWPNYLGSRQTYEQFIQQVRRDKLKIELSDRNGIYLITVPYNVPFEKIEDYIRYYLPEEVRKRVQTGQEIL